MTDWDDREFDSRLDDRDEPDLIGIPYEGLERSSSMRWPLLGGALALIAVVAILLYGFLSGVSEVPETIQGDVRQETLPPLPAPEPTEEETEAEPEAPELPSLGASDGFVRDLLTALSSHPGLASYFLSEELIRKGVVVVVNVAEGDPPARHFRDLAPEDPFDVVRRGARLYVDPLSYRRYDSLAAGFASLDAEGVAALYRRLEPLVDEAYDELGYLEGPFEDVLAKAIRVLLDTPLRETPPEVYAVSVNYAYADPRLQSLTPAQKQLLRMGPDNVRKVQAKLREIAQALELSVPATS